MLNRIHRDVVPCIGVLSIDYRLLDILRTMVPYLNDLFILNVIYDKMSINVTENYHTNGDEFGDHDLFYNINGIIHRRVKPASIIEDFHEWYYLNEPYRPNNLPITIDIQHRTYFDKKKLYNNDQLHIDYPIRIWSHTMLDSMNWVRRNNLPISVDVTGRREFYKQKRVFILDECI